MDTFIPSSSCAGEKCWCGADAAKKVGEEIAFDDPMPARHNLTAYVCAPHYAQMMGRLGAEQVGVDTATRQQPEAGREGEAYASAVPMMFYDASDEGRRLIGLAKLIEANPHTSRFSVANSQQLAADLRAAATRLAVPMGVGREKLARAVLGPAEDWASTLAEMHEWTGSAFMAGEEANKPPRGLYGFLCNVLGYLMAGEDAAKALASTDHAEAGGVEGRYLVWSNEHQAWWGKDRCGYTRVIERAGRYDRAEALSIAGTRDGGWHVRKGNPDEIAIPEQDAIDQYAAITRAQDPASPAAVAGGGA